MSRFEDFDAPAPIPDDVPFTMSAAAPTCCQPGRAVDVWGEYDNEPAQGGERRHTFRRRAGSAPGPGFVSDTVYKVLHKISDLVFQFNNFADKVCFIGFKSLQCR